MQILSKEPRGLTDGPQWSKEVQGCYGKPSGEPSLYTQPSAGQALSGHCRERETSGKAEHGRPLMVKVLY